MQYNIINQKQTSISDYLTLEHIQSVQIILYQASLPSESLRRLKWLWSNASQEEYATNKVTIRHQQHCKVSRYILSSNYKEARLLVKQYQCNLSNVWEFSNK